MCSPPFFAQMTCRGSHPPASEKMELLLPACLSRHHSGICFFSPLIALEYVKASKKTRGKGAISSGCVSQIIRLIKAKESKASLLLIPSQNVVEPFRQALPFMLNRRQQHQ
jgi:hypothetical protein